MTEKATSLSIDSEMSDAGQRERPSPRQVIGKRRGRPKGTDYRGVDAPLHEEMRRLIKEREVPSLTAAARSVVGRAYGGANTQLESKITRLVRSYPFNR